MDKETDVYRRVFSSHPHATVLFGLIDGRIEDVNEAALALYGYGREEMIGLPFSALAAAADAKLHKRKDGSLVAIVARHTTLDIGGREVGVSVIEELADPVDRCAPADLGDILVSIGSLARRTVTALFRPPPHES